MRRSSHELGIRFLPIFWRVLEKLADRPPDKTSPTFATEKSGLLIFITDEICHCYLSMAHFIAGISTDPNRLWAGE